MTQMQQQIQKILRFRDARDWKQFHSPKNVAIALALEAAEVLETFQWSPDNKLPPEKKNHLAQELADVYYYLLLLAHETGVDLIKAFDKKMKANDDRYPVGKSKGTSKKYTEL